MEFPPVSILSIASPVSGVVDTPILYALGAGGGALIVVTLIGLLKEFMAGVPQEKARREASITKQRDTAWEERDEAFETARREARRAECETRNSRRMHNYAAVLKRLLIVNGITEIPGEPSLENCDLERK